MEFFFTFAVSSGTTTSLSLPLSLHTLTAYSTKLWEHLFKVSNLTTSTFKQVALFIDTYKLYKKLKNVKRGI